MTCVSIVTSNGLWITTHNTTIEGYWPNPKSATGNSLKQTKMQYIPYAQIAKFLQNFSRSCNTFLDYFQVRGVNSIFGVSSFCFSAIQLSVRGPDKLTCGSSISRVDGHCRSHSRCQRPSDNLKTHWDRSLILPYIIGRWNKGYRNHCKCLERKTNLMSHVSLGLLYEVQCLGSKETAEYIAHVGCF